MGVYILKRLITIIPFALLAVLLVFIVFESSWNPDPLEYQNGSHLDFTDQQRIEKINCERRKDLHLDWPVFYFSITSAAIPKDIGSICNYYERDLLETLCLRNGNTLGAQNFVELLTQKIKETGNNDLDQIFRANAQLEIESAVSTFPTLNQAFLEYSKHDHFHKILIPRFEFHFAQNRFHAWLSDLLKFDFGNSTLDNQPIATKLNKALANTLIFTIPAVFFIFSISIFTGLYLSIKKGKLNSIMSNALYVIDAIPLIWLSIIFILLSAYLGMGYSTMSFGSNSFLDTLSRYGLPIFTLVLASVPYVSKQIQQTILKSKNEPFVKTAIAKGLSEKVIFTKHILPNAALPIVILFFDYLAYAFGGAFVVELVFSINGIGMLMADSVLANDLPVISAIILYLIFIKMILTLLSDVASYLINPSIKF
ncbi:ABC transporter permease [Reichenbachiella sp. MALMAid0571]|uniref:ABC transporter permease n=1 Tax=Reichenbachiella sp. MALMAid0571 TaxID=3143939 RepID=UPI0032DE9B5D